MFPSIIPPRNSCDPVMRGALLLVLVVSAATTSAQVFSPPKQFSGGQIVVDPAGNINVVSLGGTSPNFDVFFSRSTDGGTTFSVPQNLSNDGQAGQPQMVVERPVPSLSLSMLAGASTSRGKVRTLAIRRSSSVNRKTGALRFPHLSVRHP